MATAAPHPHVPPSLAEALAGIARRNGFSPEAAAAMLDALRRTGGGMAQFSHPEFGGAGQWMRGGMTMVADLFNQQLAARVDGLASQLGEWLAQHPELQPRTGTAPDAGWWPAGLGPPASSGAQDGMRYAFFPAPRRLAVDAGGRITLYDTGDHRIGGVAQQQGSGPGGIAFSSQHGSVDLASLAVVSGPAADTAGPPAAAAAAAEHVGAGPAAAREPAGPPTGRDAGPAASHDALLATIEKLADLHARGILTAEEYAAKKAELLGRL